jgi:hypothetical protein
MTPTMQDTTEMSDKEKKTKKKSTPKAKGAAATKATATKATATKATKKAATTAAKKTAAPASRKRKTTITPEQRFVLIQEAAYYIAEKDGFGGDPCLYWLQAEQKVAADLA